MPSTRFVFPLSLFCAVVLSAARSHAENTTITPREFTQKLRQLTDDPTGPNAPTLAREVETFVSETKQADVILDINDDAPWFGDDKSKYYSILRAAYIGGNAQAQLDSGHRGDEIYAGLLQLFRTYRALREKDKDFKLEGVEKLLDQHWKSELHKQVIEWENKRGPRTER